MLRKDSRRWICCWRKLVVRGRKYRKTSISKSGLPCLNPGLQPTTASATTNGEVRPNLRHLISCLDTTQEHNEMVALIFYFLYRLPSPNPRGPFLATTT